MLRMLLFWTASLLVTILFDEASASAGTASLGLSAEGAHDLEKRSSAKLSMANLKRNEEQAMVSLRKRHLGRETKKRSENEGNRVSHETSETAGIYSPGDIEISIFGGEGVHQSLNKAYKEDEDVGESFETAVEVKVTAVAYGVLEDIENQEGYEEEHDEGQESDENSADVIRKVAADRVFEKILSKRQERSSIDFGELVKGE